MTAIRATVQPFGHIHSSRMKLAKPVCAHLFLLRVFSDHVIMTFLNTRKYELDSRDEMLIVTHALSIGECFMGHLAEPVFTIAFGETQQSMPSFSSIHCNCSEYLCVFYLSYLLLACP